MELKQFTKSRQISVEVYQSEHFWNESKIFTHTHLHLHL